MRATPRAPHFMRCYHVHMTKQAPAEPAAKHGPYHPQDLRRIAESISADARIRHISNDLLPDRGEVIDIVEKVRWLLFPGFFGPRDLTEPTLTEHVCTLLDDVSRRLQRQIAGALQYQQHLEHKSPDFARRCAECDAKAAQIVTSLIGEIPWIRTMLSLDVQAAFDGDPAAQHTDEVVFCYPGLFVLSVHRVAHELYKLDVPLIPRMMSEHAHSVTGIDIHPGARIGQSFFIDHGTGVVIGETTRIGDHCRLYQGVTLGAKSFERDENGRLRRGSKRHPTLEDHVIIYAGATVLGGETTIGAGCVINGGVLVTSSVPPGHIVRGPKAEITLRGNPDMPPGNWAI